MMVGMIIMKETGIGTGTVGETLEEIGMMIMGRGGEDGIGKTGTGGEAGGVSMIVTGAEAVRVETVDWVGRGRHIRGRKIMVWV